MVTAARYPFSTPDRLNLDDQYAKARQQEPVLRIRMPFGEECWLVTRYEDAKTVLGDARFSRAMVRDRDEPRTRPVQASDGGILSMDPPDHSRLRRLVAKAFTMRRVEQLRPRAQQIADGLLDEIIEQGPPADLVEGFALPLPITVICELLGVPYADRGDFRLWSDAFLSSTHLTGEQVKQYADSMFGYMAGLVAERRVEPTDDLIGALVVARDEGDKLTEDELVQMAAGVLIAGHETTASHIPNFVYTLLTHPGKWAELRADPSLVPKAVEELMRFIPLGASAQFARYATEDIEIAGVLVKAGEPVIAAIGSANRDEAVFDDPDVLDFRREGGSHIGFGHGVHHCLGAPLARMELQVALGSLLARLPDLRFAVPEAELPWKSGMLVRGLTQLPVEW